MPQHHCCQKMTRPDAPATKRRFPPWIQIWIKMVHPVETLVSPLGTFCPQTGHFFSSLGVEFERLFTRTIMKYSWKRILCLVYWDTTFYRLNVMMCQTLLHQCSPFNKQYTPAHSGKNQEKYLSLNYTGSMWCSFILPWYEWLVFPQLTTVRWISVIMEERVWRGWETIPSSVFVEMASVETPATWQRQVPPRGWRKKNTLVWSYTVLNSSSSPFSGPCSPNPCKNDGLCEIVTPTRRGDVFNEYICKCQPGFEGVHCQISRSPPDVINECKLLHLACAPTQQGI